MIRKFEECRIPIQSYVDFDKIEESALQQLKNAASLPFAFKKVVALPDIHTGIGISIGTVLATTGVVIPAAVGVDISCGMIAIKTSLHRTVLDVISLKFIMGQIREDIPFGLNKNHKEPLSESLMPVLDAVATPIVAREYEKARHALMTGGSGNHFLELQVDTDGYVWIMIHSGSRNLGYTVANHYIEKAVILNAKYFSEVKPELKLAFLPIDSKEAHFYMSEMEYCVEYALTNRRLMMETTCDIFRKYFPEILFEQSININHNYVRFEHHFNKNVLVHRKGATSAKLGELGIIPGSQGTKSFLVIGLGNPDSFQSCSHVAGRKMSRKEAVRKLNFNDEIKILDDQGIVHGIRHQKDLDEAPGSYKDINEVMSNQSDLVDIVMELTPIAVIKG